MKVGAYLLNEGRGEQLDRKPRSKEISEEEALNLLKTKCSKAYRNRLIEKTWIFRGVESSDEPFYMVDPTKGKSRRSINIPNYYTLMIDNFKSWSKFPERGHSIMCTTKIEKAESFGYGNTFRVFPYDSAKIGVVPASDIWFNTAFPYIDKMTKIPRIAKFIKEFKYHKISDDIWVQFKSDLQRIEDKIRSEKPSEDRVTATDSVFNYYIRKKLYKTKSLFDVIEDLMDPKKNGFKLAKPGDGLPRDSEVWVGNAPSVLINKVEFDRIMVNDYLKTKET
jgi:hypothetical protein